MYYNDCIQQFSISRSEFKKRSKALNAENKFSNLEIKNNSGIVNRSNSIIISKPKYFIKKDNAGWNPETQKFSIKDIPKEIKAILKAANIKKRDLK